MKNHQKLYLLTDNHYVYLFVDKKTVNELINKKHCKLISWFDNYKDCANFIEKENLNLYFRFNDSKYEQLSKYFSKDFLNNIKEKTIKLENKLVFRKTFDDWFNDIVEKNDWDWETFMDHWKENGDWRLMTNDYLEFEDEDKWSNCYDSKKIRKLLIENKEELFECIYEDFNKIENLLSNKTEKIDENIYFSFPLNNECEISLSKNELEELLANPRKFISEQTKEFMYQECGFINPNLYIDNDIFNFYIKEKEINIIDNQLFKNNIDINIIKRNNKSSMKLGV